MLSTSNQKELKFYEDYVRVVLFILDRLEHTKKAVVVPVDCDWNDVGVVVK